MHRVLSLSLVLLLVAGSLSVLAPAPPAAAAGQISVYLGGLNWPVALAFSSDGRIFFAERLTGNIRIIQGGTLLAPPFYTLTNTATAGERGLLGLALDPGFPSTPYVYAYQTYNDLVNGTTYNRIVRITANGNLGLTHTVILAMPPLSGATNHNGGVIAFGPDGRLYAVVGENANSALAQNLMSPLGKVLRMNTDGTAPVDNPYYGSLSVNNLIYTYGHRNMFGLAWHPFTGRVYVTENGPNCNDEVNLLPNLTAPNRNFGWGPTQTCATPPPAPQNTNQDGPNPILPIWWWTMPTGMPTICPTNAAIYGGPFFPAFRGDLFMGDCNFGRFHRLHLVPPTYDTITTDTIVWTAPTSIIEVEQGPDGAIWLTTPTTIYRYWDSARPPVAAFTASPNPTYPAVPVSFDSSGSSDPDGTIVSYSWDFGDTSTGTGPFPTHSYAAPGTYRVVLIVVDNESYSANATGDVVIQSPPNQQPPVASFFWSPTPATPGAFVTFDASASFDPDGTIVSYSWEFGDTTTGMGVIATHAYASAGVYNANLTVTDNGSLSSSLVDPVIVNALPRAVITFTPAIRYAGTVVTFDGSGSSDPDGTITNYSWAFGDAATAWGSMPTHAYARRGTYSVSLSVRDDRGSTNGTTASLVVRNSPPRITSNIPAPGPVSIGTAATQAFGVTATDPDGDVLTYVWRVDGAATGGNVTTFDFSRAAPGTYTVNVTVSDGSLADSREWTVTVTAPGSGPPGPSPWIPAAVVVVIAVILGLVVLLWCRRRRKEEPTQVPLPPPSPPPRLLPPPP